MVSRSDSTCSLNSVSSLTGISSIQAIGSTEKSLELKLDNKCAICLKKFGLGARHHCRYCGNSVCGKHSSKKALADSTEKARICDNCEVEIIRKEIRAEILEEIAKINDNIEITKDNYDLLEDERQEKCREAAEIEEKLVKDEKEFKIKEAELVGLLNEEQEKCQQKDDLLERTRKEFESCLNRQRSMKERSDEVEVKIDSMRNEIEKVKESNMTLRAQIKHIEQKQAGSLNKEIVAKTICDNCKIRVFGDTSA